MKKIKFLGAILIAGAFVGCSSDDNNDSSNTSGNLLGKWFNKEWVVNGTTIPYDDHEECGKDYVEFLTATTGRYVDVWECEDDISSFIYEREGNTLILSAFGETASAQILELSSSKLRVQTNYDFDGDGDDETVVEVYTRN